MKLNFRNSATEYHETIQEATNLEARYSSMSIVRECLAAEHSKFSV